MKHSVVLFLSPIWTQDKNLGEKDNFVHIKYTNIIEGQEIDCIQTNESAVKYIKARLEEQRSSISKIYILASKKVKGTGRFLYKNVEYTWSHIDVFKKRLIDEIGFTNDQFEEIDYDEDQTVDGNINTLLELAIKIRDEHSCDKEATLHFDMTGGLRTVTQLLSSLLYLLKYSDIKVGYILYSDITKRIVENASELFDINTLISGMEEFANYGSTRSLQSYFKFDSISMATMSESCNTLIESMKAFSIAVSLCIPYEMVKAIKELKRAIEIFKNSPAMSVKEEAFKYTINTVEKEYKVLFQHVNNDVKLKLSIIYWCVKKGLLQQQLTLSTEWLPQILFQEKIFYHQSLDEIHVKASNNRTKEEEFIINYHQGVKNLEPKKTLTGTNNLEPNNPKMIVKFIKEAIVKVNTKRDVDNILKRLGKDMPKLYEFICDCIQVWEWIQGIKTNRSYNLYSVQGNRILHDGLKVLGKEHPKVDTYIRNIYKKISNNPTNKSSYGEFLVVHSESIDKFMKLIFNNISEKALLHRFLPQTVVPSTATPLKESSGIKPLDEYRRDKILLYDEVLRNNKAHSVLTREEALQFIVEFHYIKQLRNTINHASEEQQIISSKDIISKIENLIEAIEKKKWKKVTVINELKEIIDISKETVGKSNK